MNNTFTKILERIFVSKKLFYVMVPVVATAVGEFFGFDPTAKIFITLDVLFGGLALMQGVLDLRFGSASDGTAPPEIPPNPDTIVNVGNTSKPR